MEPHQKLEIFLPRLLAALERKGLPEAAVVLTWKSVMAGAKQPPIVRSPSKGVDLDGDAATPDFTPSRRQH